MISCKNGHGAGAKKLCLQAKINFKKCFDPIDFPTPCDVRRYTVWWFQMIFLNPFTWGLKIPKF